MLTKNGKNNLNNYNLKRIGFGTWSWGNKLVWDYDVSNDNDIKDTFREAIKNGLSLIDTADSYGTFLSNGRSETILGELLNELTLEERSRIIVATKIAPYPWRLTKGKVHSTDATNASRTSIFNIKHMHWDLELLEIFKVPESVLPKVHDSSFHFGETEKDIVGQKIPILAILGDQQSAAVGRRWGRG